MTFCIYLGLCLNGQPKISHKIISQLNHALEDAMITFPFLKIGLKRDFVRVLTTTMINVPTLNLYVVTEFLAHRNFLK